MRFSFYKKFFNFIVIYIFYFNNFLFCAEPKILESGKSINIYLNNNNHLNSEIKSKNDITTQIAQQLLLPILDQNKKNLFNILQLLNSYKYKIGSGLVLVVYLSTLYKIIKVHYLSNSNNSWSLWKSELSFEKLIAVPHNKLIDELLLDIQKKYYNPTMPANFVDPLVSFVSDINRNIDELNIYLKLVKIIKALRLSVIYPLNDNYALLIQEKIHRLSYLKNIFSEWAAEFRKKQLLTSTNN